MKKPTHHISRFTHLLRKYSAYLPALLMDFCLSSILTNTAFYSSYLHFSSTFLGTLIAISTAFFVILAVPCGRVSDRVGRARVLCAACLLLASVSFILPFCRRKFYLLIAFPCVGISQALFWPAYEAWLAEREGGGNLITRLMIFNLFWSIGIMIGPVISSYLYRGSNPIIPFYLAGVFSLFNWATIYFQSKSHQEVQNSPVKSPLPPFEKGGLRGDLTPVPTFDQPLLPKPSPQSQDAYLQIARVANFASWFSLGVLRQLAPKLTLEMGIPTKLFGNLMLTLGGLQTVMSLWLGTARSARWHYQLPPLIGVQLLSAAGFIGIRFLNQPILWAPAFGLIGACAAVTYFSSIYYSLHGQSDKGNKSGWHEAILGSGILLGPFLGGIFADSALGVKSPYLLCAGVIGICVLGEGFIWRRTGRIDE
ncbi:MFS transporter [Candidatus Poribacteria bacterium]|nr:MFS transporter [Candidatus Poribacteria bacterium]